MKKYPALDVCKVICACLVVMIHCLEVKEGHPYAHMIVACFSQQAVPFFFIVSGVLFAKQMDTAEEPQQFIFSYVKKQLLLFGTWTLIRLPAMICFYLELYPEASTKFIVAIILRRIFLAGYDVYWYLLALAESSLIVGIFVLHRKEKFLYVFAVIGLILGYMCDAYISIPVVREINKIIDLLFSGSNNLIMKGIPYVTIGYYFAKKIDKVKIKKSLIGIGYVAITILNIVYFMTIYNSDVSLTRFMFGYIIQAILLFALAISISDIEFSEEICIKFRGISTSVYYLHTIFIYYFVDIIWGVNSPILLKFMIPVLISVGVYWLTKKNKM